VDFAGGDFKSDVRFFQVRFDSLARFFLVNFDSVANFSEAEFNSLVDFRDSKFGDYLIFRNARINGTFLLGTNVFPSEYETFSTLSTRRTQSFDFSQTTFLSKARLELHDLVELKIQREKFDHISFADTLNYFLKKDIIENLKSKSFPNDKSAQFELEYILAKSTMYQEPSGTYAENHWYEIWKWHKWIGATTYYLTMGLGYRPFRLICWFVVIVIIYTAIYVKKIPGRINAYIANHGSNSSGEKKRAALESLGNLVELCLF
jgi:hypothetical protein